LKLAYLYKELLITISTTKDDTGRCICIIFGELVLKCPRKQIRTLFEADTFC
jgi:hypothetical protein